MHTCRFLNSHNLNAENHRVPINILIKVNDGLQKLITVALHLLYTTVIILENINWILKLLLDDNKTGCVIGETSGYETG